MPVLVNSSTASGEKNEWRTPPWVFRLAQKNYGPFELDAAANEQNHLCDTWFGPGSPFAEDALAVTWALMEPQFNFVRHPRAWCNPPFGRGWIFKFMEQAWAQVEVGNARSVTLLVPATTEVEWYQTFVWDGARREFRRGVEVDFLSPRVAYLRPDGTPSQSPNFASMLVHFYGR